MSFLPDLMIVAPSESKSLNDRNILKKNDGSNSVFSILSKVKLESPTTGRFRLERLRLPMFVRETGEGKIRDSRVVLFIPIYLEGNSASSAYWGGLEELLGNIRDFLEEIRLSYWSMPLYRKATQLNYLMSINSLLKWMHEYFEELKRLHAWRIGHLESQAKVMRERYDRFREQD